MTTRLPARQLFLGTSSFMICFAAWGLISAFAPVFRDRFALNGARTALLVAVPVLLGSLARTPMGMVSDRWGARRVLASLMVAVAVPVALVPQASSYAALVATAFCLGLTGASFPVGVDYVSRWTAPKSQVRPAGFER